MHPRSRSSTRHRSIAGDRESGTEAAATQNAVDRAAVNETFRQKSSVAASNDKDDTEMQQRRRSTMQSGRSASVSRATPTAARDAGERDLSALHDSGISSTHPPGTTDQSAPKYESAKFSTYFGSTDGCNEGKEDVALGRDFRRESRKGSDLATAQCRSRAQSAFRATTKTSVDRFDESTTAKLLAGSDSGVLLDFNERVRLRLKERIKTAEDTWAPLNIIFRGKPQFIEPSRQGCENFCFSCFSSIDRSTVRLIHWFIEWLINQLFTDWSIVWLLDWLIFDRLIDWFFDRLIDRLIDWLQEFWVILSFELRFDDTKKLLLVQNLVIFQLAGRSGNKCNTVQLPVSKLLYKVLAGHAVSRQPQNSKIRVPLCNRSD